MNLDEYPILEGYLAGCVFAFFLYFFVVVESYVVSWIFKGNVLRKNLNKIKNPSEQGFKHEAMVFLGFLLLGVVGSWLSVLTYAWSILWLPIAAVREALSSVPEEIKLLRFPLHNNPDLSKEAVWAYLKALAIKSGALPNAIHLSWELEEINGYYPKFNNEVALGKLGSLVGVDQDILSEVSARMKDMGEADNNL